MQLSSCNVQAHMQHEHMRTRAMKWYLDLSKCFPCPTVGVTLQTYWLTHSRSHKSLSHSAEICSMVAGVAGPASAEGGMLASFISSGWFLSVSSFLRTFKVVLHNLTTSDIFVNLPSHTIQFKTVPKQRLGAVKHVIIQGTPAHTFFMFLWMCDLLHFAG